MWCGSGWTGQPSVFEEDGRTWVVFGAYDTDVHFLDWEDGADILPPFPTDDIIKGSVTVDPDGFPIVYSGSRDNRFHVIAVDRPEPTELWSLSADAVSPTMWNNDWDGSALVIDDYLVEGGENSQFHIVKLNRSYGPDGLVQVDPELVFNTPGWDQELLERHRRPGRLDRELRRRPRRCRLLRQQRRAGAGVGLQRAGDRHGADPGVPVLDRRRHRRVGRHRRGRVPLRGVGVRAVQRPGRGGGAADEARPRRPDDPLVWSFANREHRPGGFWATPALHDGVLIEPDDAGEVRGFDMATGELLWQFHLPGPTWQSPVVVDDVLIQGDCEGVLHAYDVADPRAAPRAVAGDPRRVHRVDAGGVEGPDLRGDPGRAVLRDRGPLVGVLDHVGDQPALVGAEDHQEVHRRARR